MASEIEMQARSLLPREVWPPDDTEESILGTDWHQTTIINLRWGLNEIARAHTAPGQPVPWQALDQILVLGCLRHDGSEYRTFPDVFVYLHPIDRHRGSVSIGVDGPPALIIEVLSEATYDVDLNVERGKGYTYARAGVREYLALDPSGAFVTDGGRAWRLEDGVYRPWERDGVGRWVSEQIDVAIGLEGTLATVYTRAGERQLHEGEVAEERARLQAEVAELRRLLDEQRREQ